MYEPENLDESVRQPQTSDGPLGHAGGCNTPFSDGLQGEPWILSRCRGTRRDPAPASHGKFSPPVTQRLLEVEEPLAENVYIYLKGNVFQITKHLDLGALSTLPSMTDVFASASKDEAKAEAL